MAGIITVFFLVNANAIVPQTERDALVALYNSTDGANWTNNANWLVGDPCDNSWNGVTCGVNTVTQINLFRNNLTGTIPNEIGNLTNLTVLSLGTNQLIGSIPIELGGLINLTDLSLSFNQLTGSIPIKLGGLTSLFYLSLSYNQLTGSIPIEFGGLTNLRLIELNHNQLTGSIPVELGSLINLDFLYLYENKLTGTIPVELNNLNNITCLLLEYNALHSNDATTNTFLDDKCFCDWQSTQTTAPQNLQIVASSDNSISLNWDAVSYQQHGGYQINMATDSAGPFNQVAQTASKMVTAHTQGGLTTGQNYYFNLNTFTNPHISNQNLVISDASADQFDTPATTTASADLYSFVTETAILRKAFGNNQGLFAEVGDTLLYTITVGNNGPDDAIDAGFRHNIPTGLSNATWTCSVLSGTATCPAANGTGSLDELLTLPNNSSLSFNFTALVSDAQEGALLITATITPPDGVNDGNLLTNVQFMNFTDGIFTNGFE